MSSAWLICAIVTVIGSVSYNVGMKLGSPGTNPFWFAFCLTLVALTLQGLWCFFAKVGFKVDVTQGMNLHAFKYAALCGVAAAAIDIGYFIALRYGSMISTQVFWTIGGMVALAVFATLFMGEAMTLTKALGIALGVASVLLITKAP